MARKIFAVAPDGTIVASTTDNPYVCMRLFKDSDGKWRRASAHGSWERGRTAQQQRGTGVLVAVTDSKEEAQTLAELAKAQAVQVQSTQQGDTQPPAKREENDSMATEATPSTAPEAPAAEVIELNPAAGDGQNASKRSTRSGSRSSAKSGTAKKATAKKATSKKATAKKASAKKTTAAKTRSTGSRMSFPPLKSETACEKVMKQHLAAYKQYQVERDKNRNEAGMEKHRTGYKTYKNAYAQLLALRKAAGKGRRNQKASA